MIVLSLWKIVNWTIRRLIRTGDLPWMTSAASAASTPTAPTTVDGATATSPSACATATNSSTDSSTAALAKTASANARPHRSSTPAYPRTRSSPSSPTSPTAAAPARPHAWSGSAKTPSPAWPSRPGSTPDNSTTNSWLFPPNTTEVQLDEKWSFVDKKQKNCDPDDEDDWFQGDQWDHVALDPDSRLVLSVVVGKRITENAVLLLEDVKERLPEATPLTFTSDEYPAYAEALLSVFGEEVVPPRSGKPGRPAGPRRELPEEMSYATVHKERVKGCVVSVETREVFGTRESAEPVSTSYLERQNATDRHRNARKGRKTYRFSKDWDVHAAVTALTMYSYNFCWAVRTLRMRDSQGKWQQRTPAMVAGLADHVWTLEEWFTLPGVQH